MLIFILNMIAEVAVLKSILLSKARTRQMAARSDFD